jgi:Protein of unknown function (DUF3592)
MSTNNTDNEGHTSYHPVVQFVTASGQVVQYRDSVGQNPPAYRVGDPVRVLCDPANPQKARLDTWSSRWLSITILTIVGVGFLFAIVVVMLFSRESRREGRAREARQRSADVVAGRARPTSIRRRAEPASAPRAG